MLVWTTQEKSEFLILAVILYALGLVFLRQESVFRKSRKSWKSKLYYQEMKD